MVQIQFPDGAVRPYEKGITALGIAKSISEGLAKKEGRGQKMNYEHY